MTSLFGISEEDMTIKVKIREYKDTDWSALQNLIPPDRCKKSLFYLYFMRKSSKMFYTNEGSFMNF